MAHLRCPTCGQARPERAFDKAGTHLLQVIQLRGRGHGRGFARDVDVADRQALESLLDALDRARAQVASAIQAIDVSSQAIAFATQPPSAIAYPQPPAAYPSIAAVPTVAFATQPPSPIGHPQQPTPLVAYPPQLATAPCSYCPGTAVRWPDGRWHCQHCGSTM